MTCTGGTNVERRSSCAAAANEAGGQDERKGNACELGHFLLLGVAGWRAVFCGDSSRGRTLLVSAGGALHGFEARSSRARAAAPCATSA